MIFPHRKKWHARKPPKINLTPTAIDLWQAIADVFEKILSSLTAISIIGAVAAAGSDFLPGWGRFLISFIVFLGGLTIPAVRFVRFLIDYFAPRAGKRRTKKFPFGIFAAYLVCSIAILLSPQLGILQLRAKNGNVSYACIVGDQKSTHGPFPYSSLWPEEIDKERRESFEMFAKSFRDPFQRFEERAHPPVPPRQ